MTLASDMSCWAKPLFMKIKDRFLEIFRFEFNFFFFRWKYVFYCQLVESCFLSRFHPTDLSQARYEHSRWTENSFPSFHHTRERVPNVLLEPRLSFSRLRTKSTQNLLEIVALQNNYFWQLWIPNRIQIKKKTKWFDFFHCCHYFASFSPCPHSRWKRKRCRFWRFRFLYRW